jgi:hypothetical protein
MCLQKAADLPFERPGAQPPANQRFFAFLILKILRKSGARNPGERNTMIFI